MKKLKTLILSLTIASQCILPSFAATSSDYDLLASMNIMTYNNGNFNQNDNLTRGMLAKILVSTSQYRYDVIDSNISPFYDVLSSHWCAPYVTTAVNNKLLNGYLDGSYKPENNVKLEEAVTAVLNLLGYTNFSGSYPTVQINYAQNIGLLDGVSATTGSYITRDDMAQILCNALIANTSSGKTLYSTLGYNDFNLSSVIDKEFQTPVLASGYYTGYKIYVDGVSASFVPQNSLAYINHSSKMIFAYTKKVSGIITEISPNKESPESIVISGNNYSLSTTSAKNKVAINGYNTGDYVTCILDRNGNVGEIIDITSEQVTGIIINSGISDVYNGYYVSVVTTTGDIFEYPTTKDYSDYKSKIAVISTDGSVSINSSTSNLSGTISNSVLGGYVFASGATIVDISTSGEISYPSLARLNGVSLDSNDVSYASYNENDQITGLILKDVTNDADDFVYITDVYENLSGNSATSSYQYVLDGKTYSKSFNSVVYNASKGPSYISYDDNSSIKAINRLYEVSSNYSKISGNKVTFENGSTFNLADNISVYKIINDQPLLTTIDDINLSECSFYYDKTTVNGGAIYMICVK